MKKIRICMFIFVLIFTCVLFNGTTVQAKYAGEKKGSIYTYASQLSKGYYKVKIKKDNHGYYATYRNNGYFEVYLGKSKSMYFSDFAKKMGGSSRVKTTKFKVTKTERELKKLGVAVIVAGICEGCGVPWLASTMIGWVTDKGADKLFRQPGTYRETHVICTVPFRNGAIRGSGYGMTSYVYPYYKIEKKVKGKWKVIGTSTKPVYVY